MATYNRMKTPPLWFYAGLLGASLVITILLWPRAEKPIQIQQDNHDVTKDVHTKQQITSNRNGIDERHLFSFVKPRLENCDDLFEGKTPASLEYQSEYRSLSNTIQAELDHMKARKVGMEGHSGQMLKQTLTYQTLAKAGFVKTVCETGFNAGHSALLFLSTKADIHVYSFDLGVHPYGRPMAALLQKTFPGRLNVTWGDSKVTVPKFARSHPHIKCDIVIVDGGYNYREAKADLRNLRALANTNYNILIIDDHPAKTLPGVKRAWQEELSTGQLQEHFRCNFHSMNRRGFTVGKYINL